MKTYSIQSLFLNHIISTGYEMTLFFISLVGYGKKVFALKIVEGIVEGDEKKLEG
jgi:hypothetical protein